MIPFNAIDKTWMSVMIGLGLLLLIIVLVFFLIAATSDRALLERELSDRIEIDNQVKEGKQDVKTIFEDAHNSIADYVNDLLHENEASIRLEGVGRNSPDSKEGYKKETGMGRSSELLDTKEVEKFLTETLPEVIVPRKEQTQDDNLLTPF